MAPQRLKLTHKAFAAMAGKTSTSGVGCKSPLPAKGNKSPATKASKRPPAAKGNKMSPAAKGSKTSPPTKASKSSPPTKGSKTNSSIEQGEASTATDGSKVTTTTNGGTTNAATYGSKTSATPNGSKTATKPDGSDPQTPPKSEGRYPLRERISSRKKRKAAEEFQEEQEERGKRLRSDVDDAFRRRDSVTHLVASIYADVEAAVILQRRLGGMGDALSEGERSAFESSEDMRLDYLRELRLAAAFSDSGHARKLRAAALPRGKRFDLVRAARNVLSSTAKDRRRTLANVVDTLGWALITICLHSSNFQNRFLDITNADDFAQRLEMLRWHKQGIKFFARGRLFSWLEENADQQAQNALFRDLNCLLNDEDIPERRNSSEDEERHAHLIATAQIRGFPDDSTGIDHHHEWELSADGSTATRLEFMPGSERAKSQLQRNIDESRVLFEGHRWDIRGKWLLKDEPRYRTRRDDPCAICGDTGILRRKKWRADCQCSLDDLKQHLAADGGYFGDRVQLQNTDPIVGTGVIALQHFPAHSLLAEYVGEIYPANTANEGGLYKSSMYLYSQMKRKENSEKPGMYIDPSIYGNWTRYINHSCNSTAEFETYVCGDKVLTCVKVGERPVDFGQEITINYGKNYFTQKQLACRCGEDRCKLWNADSVENNKMTLSKAKKKGVAPDWAK